MLLLVDCDDVLLDTCSHWIGWINEKNDLHVRHDEVDNWDICKFFPTLSKEEVFKPLSEPLFWKTVKPKDGAVKHVKWLIDEGHQVMVVTDSHYSTLTAKLELGLFRLFPFLDCRDVIIAGNKHLIRGDILVDDNPDNLGHRKLPLLMDAPHNGGIGGYKRVWNWEDIVKEVLAIGRSGTL